MWWYRLAAGIAGATIALVTLAGSALAGGWAVTTIDALPEGGFQAGQTYRLGYTIRQHGQTPFDGARTAITAIAPTTRDRYVFPGAPDGRPGHYVAEVTFPFEGRWDWEVSQDPFAIQTLGTIAVAPAAVARPGAEAEALVAEPAGLPIPSVLAGRTAGGVSWLALATIVLPLIALGLLARPLPELLRRRRRGAEPPVVRAAE